MKLSSKQIVEILRAAGESTRLRILALLAQEELAVLELCRVLEQSQPRVSRHLKLLAEANLVERFPDGAWVFYRLTGSGQQSEVIAAVLSYLEAGDAVIARDRARLEDVHAERATAAQTFHISNMVGGIFFLPLWIWGGVIPWSDLWHPALVAGLICIAGYTIALDMTLRGTEFQCFRKSIDSYSVLGPWMVTADEITDPNALDLWIKVNGEMRQQSNTRHLVYDVARLIEFASSFYTLEPGDVIMTGTPEGVGPVRPGDVLEAGIAQVGQFTIRIAPSYVDAAAA